MSGARRRSWRAAGAASVLVLTLALAACGTTVRIGASRTLEVALDEFRIDPSAAAAPSGFLTLIVRNYGRLSHNLVVSLNGVDEGATPAIPPGREATLVVDLPPGRHTLASTILADTALGLRATLDVGGR